MDKVYLSLAHPARETTEAKLFAVRSKLVHTGSPCLATMPCCLSCSCCRLATICSCPTVHPFLPLQPPGCLTLQPPDYLARASLSAIAWMSRIAAARVRPSLSSCSCGRLATSNCTRSGAGGAVSASGVAQRAGVCSTRNFTTF